MRNQNYLVAGKTSLQTVDQHVEIGHVVVYRLSCWLRPERIERTSRVTLIPKDNDEVVFERAVVASDHASLAGPGAAVDPHQQRIPLVATSEDDRLVHTVDRPAFHRRDALG